MTETRQILYSTADTQWNFLFVANEL